MSQESLRVWRRYAGGTAWPTVWLAMLTVFTWTSAVVAHAAGWLPTFGAGCIALVAAYVSFTPLHEATHGNVGGKARPWLDAVVGWASAAPLLAPFPAFRALHLRHHVKTNDPDNDPDMWVAGTGGTLVLRCLTILPHYYAVFLSRDDLPGGARVRPVSIAWLTVLVPSLLALSWAGFASTVLGVVVVPAWLAIGVLAFLFDWLPHHPHAVQGRYVDTRAMPSKTLEFLLLGQNLHLVHHLWPAVPFYRYGTVFEACKHELAARGADIGEVSPPAADGSIAAT